MSVEQHQRLMDLFDELCDAPEAERRQRLEGLAAEEPELARQLEAMLRADEDDTDYLATYAGPAAALALARELASEEADEAPETPPPERIGTYRIIREVGRGAMGVVYEAEQAQPRRRVALKVLHRAVSQRLRRRFELEAEALGRLQHPGIARIYDAELIADPPFLALELVRGKPLTVYAHEQGLSLQRRFELMKLVCDAVHHAHLRGVLHRDLKPGNILVDDDGQPHVLDFGVARLAQSEDGTTELQTRDGQILGTPAYMSPEQARGEVDKMDARADVYSLGAILYELLADRPPHDLSGMSLHSMLCTVADSEPPPLGRLRPGLRGDPEAITGMALAADLDKRYKSAAGLSHDIECTLEHRPIIARRRTVFDSLRRLARRNRAAAFGLVGVLAAMVIGTTVSLILYLETEHARWQEYTARVKADKTYAEMVVQYDELVLERARHVLQVDPTSAVTGLRSLSRRNGTHWGVAYVLAREAQLRGIAWEVLPSHGAEVRRAAFSPDGALLATAGYDGKVRLWDLGRRTMRVLAGHRRAIRTLAFAPNGRTLASAGRDGVIRLWDTRGVELAKLAHGPGVECVAWSPNGERLVSVGGEGLIRLWSARGEPLMKMGGQRGIIEHVTWSPSGHAVATANEEGTVRVWEPATGTSRLLTGHRGPVLRVAFDASGESVASAARDGTVRVSRLAAGTTRLLEGHAHEVKAVAFVPDGASLVSADRAGEVRLWELRDVRNRVLGRHAGVVRGLSIAPDGRWAATGSDDRTVRLWDLRGMRHKELRGHRHRVREVVWSPDGRMLVSTSNDGTVRLWRADAVDHWVSDHSATVKGLSLSASGKRLVSAGDDNSVRVQELPSGAVRHLRGHSDNVYQAIFAPGGDTVISAGRDATVRVWDLTRQPPSVEVLRTEKRATRVAISPSGRWIAAAAQDKRVRVWDRKTGEASWVHGHADRVLDLQFAPDKDKLATAGQGGMVRLWDATGTAPALQSEFLVSLDDEVAALAFGGTGPHIAAGSRSGGLVVYDVRSGQHHELNRHDGGVHALALGGDNVLVSGGGDREVRHWDLDTRRDLVIGRHAASVTSVSVAGDGRMIASGGADGVVRLWDVPNGRHFELDVGHSGVERVALSPDGAWLAAGFADGAVRAWPTALPTTPGPVRQLLSELTNTRFDRSGVLASPWKVLE